MYEDFFRFDERPFPSAPRVELYFPASSAENAHQTLTRCIGRAEGPGLLIGGAGTGKSLLCHLLAARFRDAFHVVMLATARLCTRRALLQNILFELDLPYRGLEEGELRLSLLDFLKLDTSNREGVLLLVDEAHTLPLRLMEEIRMITNSVHDGQPCVRLVLAGGPALEERLAKPRLESLNQRIAARCYLQPLNYEETFEYVRSQIITVGGSPSQVFTEDALAAVHRATDGVPRLVNQVCDHALVLAVVNEQQQIDARLIEEAWSDLQQLPAPWQGPSTEAFGDEGVIEFGALEEPEVEESDEGSSVAPEPAAQSGDIDLTKQLSEIEMCVAQVEEDAAATSGLELHEEPSDDIYPEVEAAPNAEMPCEPIDESVVEPAEELSVPHTDNPFEESFDEEEIVVDHYSSLDAAGQSVSTAASGDQDSELAAAAETILQGAEQQPPSAEGWTGESTETEPAEQQPPSAEDWTGELTVVEPAEKQPPSAEDWTGELTEMEPAEQQPPSAEDWTGELSAVEPAEKPDVTMPEDAAFSEVIVQADRAFEDQAHDAEDAEDIDDQDHDANGAEMEADDVDESVSVQASVMRVPPPDDSDLIVVVDEEFDSGQASGDPGARRQDYRRLFSRLRQI